MIELDGHHHLHQQVYDRERDHWLQQQSFKVLRFWNDDVLHYQQTVIQHIRQTLHQQHSHLSQT